jgi:hypothetical protein
LVLFAAHSGVDISNKAIGINSWWLLLIGGGERQRTVEGATCRGG